MPMWKLIVGIVVAGAILMVVWTVASDYQHNREVRDRLVYPHSTP